jgi:hypothetical protein
MPTRISDLPEYTIITSSAFVPIVDVSSILDKNKKIEIRNLRRLYFTATNTSSSFTQHTPGLYYFGDNRDGNGIFTGSITNVRSFVSRSFASTTDGNPIIKNYSELFISRSIVCKPTNRCRGMLVFVDGNATISGSLSMTARGASATGRDSSFTVVNPPYLGDYWTPRLFPSSSYLNRVFATGAIGGFYDVSGLNIDGKVGINGRSGGGGMGSTYGAPTGASGGTGTSFSGGAGGGGATPSFGVGGGGSSTGGAGGNASGVNGGGGAGNPGGSPNGGSGTGGLLILIVKGDLKIGPNGSITSDGSNGGNSTSPTLGGGGGGSGGGIVYVFYGGRLVNNGNITANGGSRGIGGNLAGNGGAGTVLIQKLNIAYPVSN